MEEKAQNLYIDDHKNTGLHIAAARAKMKELKNFIESGHKIDVGNYLEWTPLMMATRNGNVEVIKYLLAHKADATRKNSFGGSVFLMAVASGSLEILQVILDHLLCGGVSKQSMESFISPLTIAVFFKNEHICRFLLEKSFNINAQSLDLGLTPMMFAVNSQNTSFANLLMSWGGATLAKNSHGESADEIIANRRQPCLQHPQFPSLTITSPQFVNFSSIDSHNSQRKSSNLQTPTFYFSPNLSPLTPMGFNQHPQVFFPPTFSPHQFLSPLNISQHMDFLNNRMQENYVFSPLSPFIVITPPYIPCPTDNNLIWPVDPMNGYGQ